MPRIDLVVETPVSRSPRARQLEGMFDVPPSATSRLEWSIEAPIEKRDWSVGLIVGPSGSGKTCIAREMFGKKVDEVLEWGAAAVIDDFKDKGIEEITNACQAVGFNTIPAWLRPFRVLSNGEQFRATLARRLLESESPIVFDEFTSVVDRQVAKIASHAVQKFVRRNNKQFVAVSCHYDIEDWLQPDWVIEPATGSFRWRSVQRRPAIECVVSPMPYAGWSMFAPYHYLTADLHRGARCWGLWADGRLAAFVGVLQRPISSGRNKGQSLLGVSRLVTLPDFQGLGLAFVAVDGVAAVYAAQGKRLRVYPAHPALVRGFDRSLKWRLIKKPGSFSSASNLKRKGYSANMGGRPNAVFEYTGPAIDRSEADRLLSYWSRGRAS